MPSIWTHVGSAFVADESSFGKYEAIGSRFRHKGSNTGEIIGRCNVMDPQDDGSNPHWNGLEVVYLREIDGDRVIAELVQVSNETGGSSTVTTFDSNDFGTSRNEQRWSVDFHHNFDFASSAYYIQIRVNRDSSKAGHPCVCIVRLTESID